MIQELSARAHRRTVASMVPEPKVTFSGARRFSRVIAILRSNYNNYNRLRKISHHSGVNHISDQLLQIFR